MSLVISEVTSTILRTRLCREQVGYAEAVRITFDSRVITYKELLEIFFAVHDPTIPNRQGNDKGTQYRSAISFCGATQRHTAQTLIKTLTEEKLYGASIVTHVIQAGQWYDAEPYHQEYFVRNPFQDYCQFVGWSKRRLV